MVAIFEIKKMPLKIMTSIITCIGRITNWRHNKKALGLYHTLKENNINYKIK